MVKAIIGHPEKCTGCRLCEISCSLYHHGVSNPVLSYIQVHRKGVTVDVPLTCTHGEDCGEDFCMTVCPVSAIDRDENGVVKIDQDACIGCRICYQRCPMHVIRMIDDKAFKCDLCGGDPQCVKVCTAGAIEFVEIGEKEMEQIKRTKELVKEVF
ncbi:MAG: 4Fe-4S dicluster domain-containing protein [Thermoplasmata archaeon]|nr:4Fe-4S dicluster domain-containing protein [Thermoplasmata archaeon]